MYLNRSNCCPCPNNRKDGPILKRDRKVFIFSSLNKISALHKKKKKTVGLRSQNSWLIEFGGSGFVQHWFATSPVVRLLENLRLGPETLRPHN